MNYYRLMLGEKSIHFNECYENNFIGVGFIDKDVSEFLCDDWREFNRIFIPIYKENRPEKTMVGAGLNCATLWIMAHNIKKSDIILCPNGKGTYFICEVLSDYIYSQNSKLPHQRKVKWICSIDRNQMSKELQRSLQAGNTLVNITSDSSRYNYSEEISSLISNDSKKIVTVQKPPVNKIKEIKPFVTNPFGAQKDSSAICITGDSGTGKSYRVEKTLQKNGHNFIFETLDPTSTGILTQYTGSGEYERNNVGEFIVKAKNDSQNFYTIVLDECHKDGFIDRINSELLQCFSTKRNGGLRFFSTNRSTDHLFLELDEKNGRRVIPDNVGFVLITSKPDIIENNDDIKNRVDIINLQMEDREKEFDINFITNTKKEEKLQFENQD